jgi:anaerobic dimethyl sulfoxide reductase subunit C (anchor subunit)
MKKGLQEWPLVVFTLAAQTAVGMLVWVAILSLLKSPLPIGPLAAGGWALALAVGGLLASLLHLGRPQRAFMAIRRLNKSWISREVILAGAFCLSTASLAISAWRSPPSFSPSTWLLGLSTILGVGLVYAMAQVYRLRTAPVWAGPLTGPGFFLTGLLLGGLSLSLLSPKALDPILSAGLLGCLIVQVGVILWETLQSSRVGSNLQPLAIVRAACLLAAFTALFFGQMIAAASLTLLGELLGRIGFYNSRSRVGI